MYIRILAFVSVLAIMSMACEPSQNQSLDRPVYELTWSDEFDGPAGTSVDTTNWNFDIGRGQSGWGNQELQFYTDRDTNVVLDGNGNLVITALSESFGGASFTSARINTKDKFDQAYGRIEASIITPYGPGLWPAFWMLGSDIDEVGWPQTGEIDIMELRGQQPDQIYLLY
jgi:beta-glucanase (GH16 family)